MPLPAVVVDFDDVSRKRARRRRFVFTVFLPLRRC